MPLFVQRSYAPVSPTCCVFCGADTGPFVETNPAREIPGYGRVYVCARDDGDGAGCAVQMARLGGALGKPEADRLFAELADAGDRVRQLEGELERVREPVTISRSEYERLSRMGADRPEEPQRDEPQSPPLGDGLLEGY